MAERKLANFLTEIIDADLAAGTHDGRVVTRFPPEPNGYLHIGHAKSICLNFSLAQQYGGDCHLRFDDTNPTTEDAEFVASIKADVRWLGFAWSGEVRFASDYFDQMLAWAEELIAKGLAYVDFSSVEELRAMRGSVGEPGVASSFRSVKPSDNLAAFKKMRQGDYDEGECVLRAKIDLASANILMRDPLLYRIRKQAHHRAGDSHCVYPMYDYAHCLEDAIEGVTHSICTLEFQNNRALYDWVIDNTSVPFRPRQFEFARLRLPYTVMSKRMLLQLVQEGHVNGWDDPRMPTLAGLRRRGVPAAAIRAFCAMIGVAKANSLVDLGKLDFALRTTLNTEAPRVLAVLDPLKVRLRNITTAQTLDAPLWPHDLPGDETRPLRIGAELFIERSDFAEEPPKGWRRLAPGTEVRLRHAWVIRCDEVIKDAAGEVVELVCSVDLATLGAPPVGRSVRGAIHWVDAASALPATVHLIERLFNAELPGSTQGVDFVDELNPGSLQVIKGALVEPYAAAAAPGSRLQFERSGYYYRDPEEPGLVFNRIVTLRDSWAKQDEAPKPRKARQEALMQPVSPAPLVPDELEQQVAALVGRGLSAADAVRLCRDPAEGARWEAAVAAGADPAAAAKLLLNDLRALSKDLPDPTPLSGVQIGEFLALVDTGRLARPDATTLLRALLGRGGSVAAVAAELGVLDRDDGLELQALIDDLLAQHPDEVARFRGGEERLFGFLMGAAMRAAHGRADAKALQGALRARLG